MWERPEGIFDKYDIDLEIDDLGNRQQAASRGSASTASISGLGAGTESRFRRQGLAGALAWRAFASEPRTVVVIVSADSRSRASLISEASCWPCPARRPSRNGLCWQMALTEGWARTAFERWAQGSVQANVRFAPDASGGRDRRSRRGRMEAIGRAQGRIVVPLAQFAPHFIPCDLSRAKRLIQENSRTSSSASSRVFSASIAFMKSHKDETSAIAARTLQESRAIADRTYDYEISMLSDNGAFDPQALAVLKDSFVQLGLARGEAEG